MEKVIPSLPHENDGIIFTPVYSRYCVAGTDSALLKWKPPDKNSVDFRVVQTQAGFELHTRTGLCAERSLGSRI